VLQALLDHHDMLRACLTASPPLALDVPAGLGQGRRATDPRPGTDHDDLAVLIAEHETLAVRRLDPDNGTQGVAAAMLTGLI